MRSDDAAANPMAGEVPAASPVEAELERARPRAIGEADRFAKALAGAWDFLHGYETMAPLIELIFDDGRQGAADDLEDVPLALFRCLTEYMEIPHAGWLHTVARVFTEAEPFDLRLAFQGLDGPLVLRFSDDSMVTYSLDEVNQTSDERASPDDLLTWEDACASGRAQSGLEAIVGLMELSGITRLFEKDDRLIAEALAAFFGACAKTQSPPKPLLREALHWLQDKVDRFVNEAVAGAGKAVGTGVVVTLGLVAEHYFPSLAHEIAEVLRLSEHLKGPSS
jgi:hypothetical protein